MLRRRHGVSLSRSSRVEEEVNPNEYISNIADCMLVLLLGMVVALISYYNIDLSEPPEPEEEIIGIEVNLDQNQDGVIDPEYQRRGEVYFDELNGTYYFVTN